VSKDAQVLVVAAKNLMCRLAVIKKLTQFQIEQVCRPGQVNSEISVDAKCLETLIEAGSLAVWEGMRQLSHFRLSNG
jgi:hypothetical protein